LKLFENFRILTIKHNIILKNLGLKLKKK